MSTRTVAVKLTAEVGSYVAGMRNAANATRDFGKQVAADSQTNADAWTEVGTAMIGVGAAAGAGVGVAVKKFADFDQAMSNVKAATFESAGAMTSLRDAALDAGARTAFSATEAANGIEELAKAGVSTSDILQGGLNGALDLAAAGGLGVADAAEIAATALEQFNLKGSQMGKVADLLAAGAGKAQGSVGDMGMALKQAGLVANQTGLSIEETTGGLAAFASAGLIGSDAGTSFKSMLQRLTPQSAEAASLMDELGISAYDAQGNFVGLEGFAGNLRQALVNLTPEQRNSALATIFGSDAVRAASVLYENGAEGIRKWTGAVDDQGYAAETAALRMDNLKGDIEQFTGSLDTALIKSGSGANNLLREMTQLATGAVNAYGALPAPVQTAVTLVGTVGAVVSIAGGAFLVAVPKVIAFKETIGQMGRTANVAAGAMSRLTTAMLGPLGIALSVGTIALGIYGAKRAETKARIEEFTRAIQADSGAVGENARALAAKELADKGAFRTAKDLGLSVAMVTDAALGNQDALGRLRDLTNNYGEAATEASRRATQYGGGLDAAAVAAGDTAGASEGLLDTVEKLATATDGGVAAAKLQAEALAVEGASATGAAAGIGQLGAAQDAAAPKAEKLTDAQKELASALTSFVDPLGVYTDLLQKKEDAERATAEKTATAQNEAVDKQIAAVRRDSEARIEAAGKNKGTTDGELQALRDRRDGVVSTLEDSKKSWEDYAGKVTVSLTEVSAQLEADNLAHEQWRANLVKIAGNGGSEVAAILATMGEEGVRLTALMANGTAEESARAARAIIANARIGTDGASVELDRMITIAGTKGKLSADALAKQLGIGADEVAAIAARYGLNLASGINPLLAALGKAQIDRAGINDGRSRSGYAEGGPIWGAGTATSDSIPAYLSNGEYVIKAGSVEKYGQRFFDAVNAGRFAVGGFAGPADVPRPTSTAPYGAPLSTGGDRTMERAYGEAVEWITANSALKGSATGLNAAFLDRFNAYKAALGGGLAIVSGFRSYAEQAALYQRWVDKVPGQAPAAAPGSSNHERGLAIDHSPRSTPAMRARAADFGLRYPMSYEPWHVEPASVAMANGGVINEPVVGRGLRSGGSYSFGERGPETVIPGTFAAGGWVNGSSGGSSAAAPVVRVSGPNVAAPSVQVFIDGREITSAVVRVLDDVALGASVGLNN